MPLIISTFFFYSVESLIAGVRKTQENTGKHLKAFYFVISSVKLIYENATISESRGKTNK